MPARWADGSTTLCLPAGQAGYDCLWSAHWADHQQSLFHLAEASAVGMSASEFPFREARCPPAVLSRGRILRPAKPTTATKDAQTDSGPDDTALFFPGPYQQSPTLFQTFDTSGKVWRCPGRVCLLANRWRLHIGRAHCASSNSAFSPATSCWIDALLRHAHGSVWVH